MHYQFHHFETIGSTNDEAKRLAELGAPEGTVVTAETQTSGRGRGGRSWITPHGAALAMSLVLRPATPGLHAMQISLLGGLAVLEGARAMTALPMQIKWPNDVLVRGKKVSGVLAEAIFSGERLEYVVLGMGVNVNGGPPPASVLDYEATSLAAECGRELDRAAVRDAILSALQVRYPHLGSPALAEAWQRNLAMLGQPIWAIGATETLMGTLVGVTAEGALRLSLEDGSLREILSGDVHLREA